MSEAPTMGQPEADHIPKETNEFSLEVQIGGLPYVLNGEAPVEPSHFDLVVSLPPDKWTEAKTAVQARADTDSWYAMQYRQLQSTIDLGEGKVGSVWVAEADARDGAPSIGVTRIQTDNRYLPESNEYYDQRGVGSFVLDNLCAFADVRGWRIYLEPLDRGGRLMQGDLVDWYTRKGFDIPDRGKESSYGGMVRMPQTPDPVQPMTQFLSQ